MDKTMDDKSVHIPNYDKRIYHNCKLKFNKGTQSILANEYSRNIIKLWVPVPFTD